MEELRAVSDAAGDMGYPWGPWYRLILLTGDRRSEWARARWDWLTANLTRLEIPASEYKTAKSQVVPLSAQAQAIIASLPRGEAGPYLFSSDGGARAVSGFSKAKARLDRLIADRLGRPLPPWVVHDLRRSMATHMERIGIEPHIIEVCLGHSLKGVAGIYRQYGYLPEKAHALQAWADELLPAYDDGPRVGLGGGGRTPTRNQRSRSSTTRVASGGAPGVDNGLPAADPRHAPTGMPG
jgi:integrase